jgi:hypothetical protein
MITQVNQLISMVESSNNLYAVRFEPTHVPASEFVSRMQAVCVCSPDTAKVLCQTSWGLYQIMGDELMAKGLSISPIAYCQQPVTQGHLFQQVLKEKGLDAITLDQLATDQDIRLQFAKAYNGPGNMFVYAARLLQTYQQAQREP